MGAQGFWLHPYWYQNPLWRRGGVPATVPSRRKVLSLLQFLTPGLRAGSSKLLMWQKWEASAVCLGAGRGVLGGVPGSPKRPGLCRLHNGGWAGPRLTRGSLLVTLGLVTKGDGS